MRNVIFILIAAVIVSCGGKQPQESSNVVSVEDYESSTFSVEAKDASVQGLLGNVTQDEIERVFSNHQNAMLGCYQDAIEDLEEIEGELRFEIQVASDGTVDSAFISSSTLGSIDTESCMLDLVEQFHFERAPGGVAVIYYPLTLEAPYDPPEPEIWTNQDVAKVILKNRSDIDACFEQSSSGVHVTLYVGKGGMVLSSGASGETLDAYKSATCLARSAQSWVFSDPGGDELVKVELDF